MCVWLSVWILLVFVSELSVCCIVCWLVLSVSVSVEFDYVLLLVRSVSMVVW